MLAPQEIQNFCQWLKLKTSISLNMDKAYLIESRLASVIKDNKFQSVQQLFDILLVQKNASAQIEKQVINVMTTNETSFFRDQHPFDTLQKVILPELIKLKQSVKTLNIWSAAASSGQEVYSLVMLIKEYFPQLASWKINITATDISSLILERAKSGIFNQFEVSRGLSPSFLTKYFQRPKQSPTSWQIRDDLRSMVQFQLLNLSSPLWPLSTQFDLVLIRNVLIYFEMEDKKKILDRIKKTMNPQGVLMLGSSETLNNVHSSFVAHKNAQTIYYKFA